MGRRDKHNKIVTAIYTPDIYKSNQIIINYRNIEN